MLEMSGRISQRSIATLLGLVVAMLPAIGAIARGTCVLPCCVEVALTAQDTCCENERHAPIPAGDRESDPQDHGCSPQCMSPACRAIDLPHDRLEITNYDTFAAPSLECGVSVPSAFAADAIFHPPRG